MRKIFKLSCLLVFTVLFSCADKPNRKIQTNSEANKVIIGGGCDGCELMFQGMPKNLFAVDTSAGWKESGQKLVVEGTVFKLDGKTAAPNVILYYWQTDNNGLYSKTAEESTIHGHIRGWLKTDKKGNYKIYTIRPASYPKSTIPAHIHYSVKEPDISNEYYIDDVLFDDDPFLTAEERAKLEERGGNGIGKTKTLNNLQFIRRDIILGLNIPNYPE